MFVFLNLLNEFTRPFKIFYILISNWIIMFPYREMKFCNEVKLVISACIYSRENVSSIVII